jgi:hypothetical protein
MYSKIGNLIWKEMRLQGLTQAQLSQKIKIPNVRFSRVFTKEKIDPRLLSELSRVLDKNFLQADELKEI